MPTTGRTGAGPRPAASRRIARCRSDGARRRTSRGKRRSPAPASRRRSSAAIASTSPRRSAPASGARATIRGSCRAATPRRRGSARSAPDAAAGADAAKTFFVVEAFARADGKRVWERRIEATGDADAGPRQAQPRDAQPGHRRHARLRLVRHGPDRRRSIATAPSCGSGTSARRTGVRHPVGTRQLAGALRRLPDPALRPPAASYLLALDKRTGKDRGRPTAARAARPTARRSSSKAPVGSRGDRQLDRAHRRLRSAQTARRSGTLARRTGSRCRRRSFHDGVIYASRGYRSGPYMAIKPGGRGDVTSTHVVWRVATGAPYVLVAALLRRHRLHGERRRRADGRRCRDRRARLAGARRRRLLGLAGRRRRSRLLRQRETATRWWSKAGRAPQVVARNASASALRVSGDLERADVHPHRRHISSPSAAPLPNSAERSEKYASAGEKVREAAGVDAARSSCSNLPHNSASGWVLTQ